MGTPPTDGGIQALIVVRKYGSDVRIWRATAEDGSGRVGPMLGDPSVDATLAEQAREGWTLMRMSIAVLGGSATAAVEVLGDVHPNLQALCEHGSWFARFMAVPEAGGEEAMEALAGEHAEVFGSRAEHVWMLMIGFRTKAGDLTTEDAHLLRMQGVAVPAT